MPWTVLSDPAARKYVSGVAWHCYEGDVPAQSQVHDAFPDKDTWFTECSGGEWAPKFGETLGWMASKLIIGASNHWSRGTLLWNLALDPQYGPHKGGCGDCRGVITIDPASGAITRNVEYYALGSRQPLRSAGRASDPDRRPATRMSRQHRSSTQMVAASPFFTARRARARSTLRSTANAILSRCQQVPSPHCAGERAAAPSDPADQDRKRTLLAFAAVTTLFFAWGFITSNNDPLIVALRAAFSLTIRRRC